MMAACGEDPAEEEALLGFIFRSDFPEADAAELRPGLLAPLGW